MRENPSVPGRNPCRVVSLGVFLRRRFRGDKEGLCTYLLQISKGSKYRYSAAFFGTRTFDQLVDFCVRIITGVGDEAHE